MSNITDPKNFIKVYTVDEQMNYNPECAGCAYKLMSRQNLDLDKLETDLNKKYEKKITELYDKYAKFYVSKQQEVDREMARMRAKEECVAATHKRELTVATRTMWFWRLTAFSFGCLALLAMLIIIFS